MLQLHGDLNSGMDRDNSGFQKPQYKQPNHYKQYEPTNQVSYSRVPNNQMASRLGSVLDGLEPVKDEFRKKPFTVPTVNVKLTCENVNMEVSNIKTQVNYVD
jgi:hypothetical protein